MNKHIVIVVQILMIEITPCYNSRKEKKLNELE